jgi:hypothetical protein
MPNAPTDIPVNVDGTYREPTWGEGGSFSQSGHEANGAGAGVMIGANDFNEPRRHSARWIRALITRTVPSDAGLFGSFLVPGSGGWNVSGGTLNGTLGASWILVDADDDGGVVIQYNVTAGSPHVFTASRDTYVDLAEDGTATYTAVANGAPEPAVAASSVRVWKVVTDGTEITAATGQLPEMPVFKDIAAESLAITDLLAVGGDLDVTGNLTVGGDSALGDDAGDSHTITGSVDITGDTAITGAATITGDLAVTGTTHAISGATTITGSLTVAADNPANFTGNVTLGSASGDAVISNGTTTFNAAVTVANGVNFTANGNSTLGNAGTDTLTINAETTHTAKTNIGANEIEGTAGSIVDVEIVEATEIRFDSDASPSTTTGVMQCFGRGVSIGLSSAAKRISIPFDNYVASLANTASDSATGASVTVTLATGDVVYVTASADLWNTDAAAGSHIVFEIVIDGSVVNSPGNLWSPAQNVPITCYREVKYTAVADGPITFVQRYGADTSSTTGQNGFISVRQGN